MDDGRSTIGSGLPSVVHRRSSAPGALLDAIRRLQGMAIPASILESHVLPARVPGYDLRELDMLFASGQVLWVGAGPLAPHDGRVRLLLSERAPYLLGEQATDDGRGAVDDRPDTPSSIVHHQSSAGDIHSRVRSVLAERGACFFPHLLRGVGGFPPEVLEALWELVWAGEVTNDTLQPLREYLNPQRDRKAAEIAKRRPGAIGRYRPLIASPGYTVNRPVPPEATGRWSLVSDLVMGRATPTQRLTAWSEQFLERYGVLTREAVAAEELDGGFGAVYGVLKALEDAGRVRRGYFVAGLGATQFALPEAVERLRTVREPPDAPATVLLASADPANPYGAALAWPERSDDHKPSRAAGTFTLLVDGCLAAWLARGGGSLLTFLDQPAHLGGADTARAIAVALADAVNARTLGGLLIEDVDGHRPWSTPLGPALEAAGFARTTRGYLKRRG